MKTDPLRPFSRKAAVLLALIPGAVLLTGCFRVSSDTQALRDAVFENSEGMWLERMELSLGRLTFAAAQLGTRFVEVPPEARSLLNSMKGAEASVWEFQGGGSGPDLHEVMAQADGKMSERGWSRLVGVVEEGRLLAVYLPETVRSEENVRVCVLVFDERQLVCAAARSDLKPLMRLAMRKVQEESEFARKDGPRF